MNQIYFGIDGWRGIIAQDFTFDNVKMVGQALSDYLKTQGGAKKGLIVGYDTRFLSDKFARALAEVVASNDIHVLLVSKPTPTPIVSFAVKNRKVGGGVVITAGHNSSIYNGVKFKSEYGGPAPTEVTKQMEGYLEKAQPKHDEKMMKKHIRETDFENEYIDHIKKLMDLELIKDAGFRIVFDAMHGAGNKIIERLLTSEKCRVITIRGQPDPTFGGANPEPIIQNLTPLMQAVVTQRANIGLATDGDSNRFGVISAEGTFVTPHEVFALILIHLHKNRGLTGGVVKTASVCNIVSQIAAKYKLPVYETPVGFKNVCEIMMKQDILIGGEESNGLGFKNHVPERDGILAVLFLLEMMAMERKGIDQLLAELRSEFGELYYDRIDFPYDKLDGMNVISKLQARPPSRIAGLSVEKAFTYMGVEGVNGIKFNFTDKRSWLLIRGSETEPIIRIYSESTSNEKVKQLLKQGLELVKKAT
jgi:alpha-D-glucose phosphate-specific phosphoglucomutase